MKAMKRVIQSDRLGHLHQLSGRLPLNMADRQNISVASFWCENQSPSVSDGERQADDGTESQQSQFC